MQVSLASQIFSQLGNTQSLLPLAVKDFVNSAGITYTAYQNGGHIEGKDRFIDEFGTELIWLGGIPTIKWAIDKTLYKALKYDPGVDVRVISSKNPDYIKLALENAPDETVKANIQKALENSSTFKKLFYSKFAVATAATLGLYHLMTKFKQEFTHSNIEKEYYEKVSNNLKLNAPAHSTFAAFGRKKSNVSFEGAVGNFFQSFMFDPVRNTSIIDLGIEGKRLSDSRNNTERGEYLIKGLGFLGIMYFAGEKIEKAFNKLAAKLFNVPIELDSKVLDSEVLQQAAESKNNFKNELNAFKAASTETDVLNFIFKNQDNIVTKAAKLSGAISVMKNSDKIDTSKFIDYKRVQTVADDLEKFLKALSVNEKTATDFIKKAKNLKIGSVIANIATCCFALGFILPKVLEKYRTLTSGTTDFHVKKEVEAKLAQKGFCGLQKMA